MKTKLIFFTIILIGAALFGFKLYSTHDIEPNKPIIKHLPNQKFINQIEKKVIVTLNPEIKYNYDFMKKGVIQHLDRNYTYDYIPEELENGILFQGMHRPMKGTSINIELFEPSIIYFFFHSTVDGGYTQIFENSNEWIKCLDAPKYDVNNGDHGLHMTMYKLYAEKGTYMIPATLKDRACFNMVFKFM